MNAHSTEKERVEMRTDVAGRRGTDEREPATHSLFSTCFFDEEKVEE